MIIIGKVIVADEVVQEHFLCNLSKCKGACCIEGESGAPLEYDELKVLEHIYDSIEPYLTSEGRDAIKKNGKFVEERKGVYKAPLIGGKACAYVNFNANGIAYCGIQKAYDEGKINFEKPISCHLYPVRVKQANGFEYIHYEEWSICKPACLLGKTEKLPLYKFLKEPLIRKFGNTFYNELELAVKHTKANGE